MLIYRWLTRRWLGYGDTRAPIEAIALRTLGLAYLVVFIVDSITTRPHPGLHGRGALVLVAIVVFVASAVATQPQREDVPVWWRVALLLLVTACGAVLAAVQPNGIWPAGPYFVGIIAALRLDRRAGVLTIASSVVALLVVATVEGRAGTVVSVLVGSVP